LITATEFLRELIKKRMNDSIVNDRFPKKYPISKNIFSLYSRETRNTFADGACDGLIAVVQGEIKENLEKRFNVISYLITFLDCNDYAFLNINKDIIKIGDICNNYDLTKKITTIVINKFRKNKKNTKNIDKDFYIKAIISEHEKILTFLNKEFDVSLVLIKKLLSTTSKMALALECCKICKKHNALELALSKKIFPNSIEHIIISLNNLTKIDKYTIHFCDTSLKILIDWFIQDFLKRTHPVKTLNEVSEETELKIVDLHDLISMGWTIEDYVREGYKVWREVVDDFDEIHKDEMPYTEEIVLIHMESRKVLMNQNNQFVGYWNFDLLYDEPFEIAKKGLIGEGDIKKNYIPYQLPGTYNMYFDSVFISKQYKKTSFALRKILYSILETFEEMAKIGVFINEICTWGFTDEGINLCRSIGMTYVCNHQKEDGQIFVITMQKLLDHPMCKNFTKLKNSYIKNTIVK
jgi:hypothetical protein